MASFQLLLVIAIFTIKLVSSESSVDDLTVKEKRVLDRVTDILDKTVDGMSLTEFQVLLSSIQSLGGPSGSNFQLLWALSTYTCGASLYMSSGNSCLHSSTQSRPKRMDERMRVFLFMTINNQHNNHQNFHNPHEKSALPLYCPHYPTASAWKRCSAPLTIIFSPRNHYDYHHHVDPHYM